MSIKNTFGHPTISDGLGKFASFSEGIMTQNRIIRRGRKGSSWGEAHNTTQQRNQIVAPEKVKEAASKWPDLVVAWGTNSAEATKYWQQQRNKAFASPCGEEN